MEGERWSDAMDDMSNLLHAAWQNLQLAKYYREHAHSISAEIPLLHGWVDVYKLELAEVDLAIRFARMARIGDATALDENTNDDEVKKKNAAAADAHTASLEGSRTALILELANLVKRINSGPERLAAAEAEAAQWERKAEELERMNSEAAFDN